MASQTVITTASTGLPVELANAKEHLRVINGDLDEYIVSLVEAATDYCESVTGRALRESLTVQQTYAEWPCEPLRFDRQPVKSISSITYWDEDNVSRTVASTNYRLYKSTNAAAFVRFITDYAKPLLYYRDDAITVTYVAGYESIAAIPARAKHAIKLLIGHWFEHGETVNIGNITTEVPMATKALLDSLDWGVYR
jgi:uncharacterized phiE125 gp8 family phage protein